MNTIYVPKYARVFIVEDDMNRIEWFRKKLGSRIYGVHWRPETAIGAFAHMSPEIFDLIFLDHDLGGPYAPPYTTAVAEYLYNFDPDIGPRVMIHSLNPVGAKNLQAILPGSVLMPFGTFDIKDRECEGK